MTVTRNLVRDLVHGVSRNLTDDWFTSTPGFSLDALTLAWATAASDNTPGFDISGTALDLAPVGAQIELQISTDVGFTPPPADEELSAVSGNPTTVAVSPALSDGQYWARARLLDSGDVALTDWSNVVTETIDATAPTITSSNAVNQAENAAFSHTLTANESVTWTKTGGADTALFTLAGSNLSMTAKDFETPTDADTNNTYVVQVTATDAAGNATNQTITVTVTDVAEGGSLAPLFLLMEAA